MHICKRGPWPLPFEIYIWIWAKVWRYTSTGTCFSFPAHTGVWHFQTQLLIYWDLRKMAAIYRGHFQMHCLNGKYCISIQIHWKLLQRVQLTRHDVAIGSGSGSASNRRQDITWSNGDQDQWRHMASLSYNGKVLFFLKIAEVLLLIQTVILL